MRVLLMSHGNLAKEMLKSAEMILGPIQKAQALGLQPNQGPDDLQKAAEEFLNDNPSHESTLCLVDLLGGTPSNVVVKLMAEYPDLEVISGLNLPMLVDYANQNMMGQTFDKSEMIEAAKTGIQDINVLIKS